MLKRPEYQPSGIFAWNPILRLTLEIGSVALRPNPLAPNSVGREISLGLPGGSFAARRLSTLCRGIRLLRRFAQHSPIRMARSGALTWSIARCFWRLRGDSDVGWRRGSLSCWDRASGRQEAEQLEVGEGVRLRRAGPDPAARRCLLCCLSSSDPRSFLCARSSAAVEQFPSLPTLYGAGRTRLATALLF